MGVVDLLLSVAVFAAVTLLVLSVFGQPGQIKLSPEREIALATGHLDRRTIFENRLLQPLVWILLAASHRLAMPKAKAWLRRTLVAAGSPNFYTAEEYLTLSMLTGLVTAVALAALSLVTSGEVSYLLFFFGGAVGTSLALYQIYSKASTRTHLIARRLPYALDLIALAMGAGATFTEAVRSVVRENVEDPLNVELKSLLAEMDLGATRRKALESLAARVPLDSLRSIVASVIQSEELGTPLVEVLHSQATLLRLQRTIRAENAAAVASVRILIPGLMIAISVVIAVFAPAIIRAVRGGLF
jgi:tight adherence protein C